MTTGGNATSPTTDLRGVQNVFTDTCILLNYIQRGIEPDRTSALVDSDEIDIVLGVTVAEEIEDVEERRSHIYEDFVDFVIQEGGAIGDYNPRDRRPYFQENDRRHVQEIQMQLSQLADRAEIQRRLRKFTRAVKRRVQYLREEVIPEALYEHQPGITLLFALDDVIGNKNDRNVIADAALWAAEARDSSGVFLTRDSKDIITVSNQINEALREAKDETWQLRIHLPTDIPSASNAKKST